MSTSENLWNIVKVRPQAVKGQGMNSVYHPEADRYLPDNKAGFRVINADRLTIPFPSMLGPEETLRFTDVGNYDPSEQQTFMVMDINRSNEGTVRQLNLATTRSIRTLSDGVPLGPSVGDLGIITNKNGKPRFYGYDLPPAPKPVANVVDQANREEREDYRGDKPVPTLEEREEFQKDLVEAAERLKKKPKRGGGDGAGGGGGGGGGGPPPPPPDGKDEKKNDDSDKRSGSDKMDTKDSSDLSWVADVLNDVRKERTPASVPSSALQQYTDTVNEHLARLVQEKTRALKEKTQSSLDNQSIESFLKQRLSASSKPNQWASWFTSQPENKASVLAISPDGDTVVPVYEPNLLSSTMIGIRGLSEQLTYSTTPSSTSILLTNDKPTQLELLRHTKGSMSHLIRAISQTNLAYGLDDMNDWLGFDSDKTSISIKALPEFDPAVQKMIEDLPGNKRISVTKTHSILNRDGEQDVNISLRTLDLDEERKEPTKFLARIYYNEVRLMTAGTLNFLQNASTLNIETIQEFLMDQVRWFSAMEKDIAQSLENQYSVNIKAHLAADLLQQMLTVIQVGLSKNDSTFAVRTINWYLNLIEALPEKLSESIKLKYGEVLDQGLSEYTTQLEVAKAMTKDIYNLVYSSKRQDEVPLFLLFFVMSMDSTYVEMEKGIAAVSFLQGFNAGDEVDVNLNATLSKNVAQLGKQLFKSGSTIFTHGKRVDEVDRNKLKGRLQSLSRAAMSGMIGGTLSLTRNISNVALDVALDNTGKVAEILQEPLKSTTTAIDQLPTLVMSGGVAGLLAFAGLTPFAAVGGGVALGAASFLGLTPSGADVYNALESVDNLLGAKFFTASAINEETAKQMKDMDRHYTADYLVYNKFRPWIDWLQHTSRDLIQNSPYIGIPLYLLSYIAPAGIPYLVHELGTQLADFGIDFIQGKSEEEQRAEMYKVLKKLSSSKNNSLGQILDTILRNPKFTQFVDAYAIYEMMRPQPTRNIEEENRISEIMASLPVMKNLKRVTKKKIMNLYNIMQEGMNRMTDNGNPLSLFNIVNYGDMDEITQRFKIKNVIGGSEGGFAEIKSRISQRINYSFPLLLADKTKQSAVNQMVDELIQLYMSETLTDKVKAATQVFISTLGHMWLTDQLENLGYE